MSEYNLFPGDWIDNLNREFDLINENIRRIAKALDEHDERLDKLSFFSQPTENKKTTCCSAYSRSFFIETDEEGYLRYSQEACPFCGEKR